MEKNIHLFHSGCALYRLFDNTVAGYNGVKDTQFQDYMKLMNDARIYVINGEDTKAIELLEEAIANVDEKRPEAYINLLDIYINNDETDAGLAKVETYIGDEYGNIHKNNEVLFKLGMTYFDVKRDYVSALRYFQQVDTEKIPDAGYYKTLATTMSKMNINYEKFTQELVDFETYNDQLPNNRKKIDNYYSLANIYSSYKGQIDEANTKTIESVEKAYEVLDLLEDQNLNLSYESKFEDKLAESYYSRAINTLDQSARQDDFEQAIDHYHNLLDLNVENEPNNLLKIGTIYQEMGEYVQAAEQFVHTIKEYPEEIQPYINLANLLIDIEQSRPEEQRNYAQVLQIYEEVSSLVGASESQGYKKLKRRMENLNLL